MDITVYAKNIELNPEAEQYIQKKFSRLQRHLKAVSDAKLEVSRTSARSQPNRIVAQMTLTTGGRILRGQESGMNLFAAVDAVTDIMDRQIRRFKGKVYRNAQGKKAGKITPLVADDSTDFEDMEEAFISELGSVVRTKRFPMKPMSVEDAVMQMELLSHDFFLFYNDSANEYNVVYRRSDGGYGVIEPELA